MPASGGEEVVVLPHIADWDFAVARDGIYFQPSPPKAPLRPIPILSPFTRPEITIEFFSFATGRTTQVLTMLDTLGMASMYHLTGRTLLWAQPDSTPRI